MLELIINKNKENKIITLVENGKLLEVYEENNQDSRNEGNIYIGVVKDIVKGMQSAFVDIGTEKNSLIHLKDILPKIDQKKESKDFSKIDIKDVIKPNDKLMVQIKKDSNEKKGARVSTHINLPSKYIVLMPNTDIITISQKIESQKEQERLFKIVKANLPQNMGAIIRTSAQDKSEEDIIKDVKHSINKWNTILKTKNKLEPQAPQKIYESQSIEEKIIIDTFNKNLKKIIVNNKEEYKKMVELQKENDDYNQIEIALEEKENILQIYDLEKQIAKTKERKVWLNCGGFITIDKTEALTAIDVNTGKYTGSKSLEETVYKVNKEATTEIAKQLKLRDIGGIIIIDYIDMNSEANKQKIEELLKEELKKDRAKTQVEGFTKLDLMELTRKHICSHND